MPGIRRFLAKGAGLLFRGRADRDLAREIDAHLALLEDEFVRRGMSPDAARSAALRAYGGVERAKELHRDERTFPWVEELPRDLRYAARQLFRSPGFTLAAVLVLALGIGVNTTLFTTYNAVALKPLPVRDPDRVMRFERWVEDGGLGNFQYGFSYPDYVYCREHNTAFSALVAASWIISVKGSLPNSAPVRLAGQLVSPGYFSDFGIRLRSGRAFLPGETGAVAVISHSLWKRVSPDGAEIPGQIMKLNGTPFTIIGVAPEEFTGTSVNPQVPDFWAPVSMQAKLIPGQDWPNQPTQRFLQIFARLKPVVAHARAQAEADLLVRQFSATYRETNRTTAVTLQRTTYFPNTDDIRFRAVVAALMLIVGLVLLVACANVGNMLLARGAARQREISTRRALGASRSRIVRQLLAESILLSCLGGVAGLAASLWSTRLVGLALQRNAALIGGDFAAVNLAPDPRVMLYLLTVSISTGILFGLSPALQATGRDITSALKDAGGSLGGFGGARPRNFLVAAQVAVSMLLLATAGLLTRGLIRSQAADPGFETHEVFVLTGDFGPDPATILRQEERLVERLRARPEFAGAALGNRPFAGTWTPPIVAGSLRGSTLATYASDRFLSTLGIPLVRGRDFTFQEAAVSAPLAIISESTARQFWPNEDPLGKRITLDMNFRGKIEGFEVVGIAKDVRYANLTRVDPAHVYLPGGGNFPDILVRIRGDRQRALAAAGMAMASLNKELLPNLRLINLEEGLASAQRAMSRGFAVLAMILAMLTLTLAGVGIYGVVACLVSQRTREIGVRMALGATRGVVLKSVIIHGLRPVFGGMALGLAAAAALSSVLHQTLIFPGSMDFLYGVPFYDPLTFVGLSCFVVAVTALASAVPARRALRVDPMVALRYE